MTTETKPISHTQTWHCNSKGGVRDEHGELVASCANATHARRIVACVNACKGMKTDMLEQAIEVAVPALLSYRQMMEQNAELVATLRKVETLLDSPMADLLDGAWSDALTIIHATLAKVPT